MYKRPIKGIDAKKRHYFLAKQQNTSQALVDKHKIEKQNANPVPTWSEVEKNVVGFINRSKSVHNSENFV